MAQSQILIPDSHEHDYPTIMGIIKIHDSVSCSQRSRRATPWAVLGVTRYAGFLISVSTLSQTGPTETSTAPPVVYHWANQLIFDVH